MCIVGSSLRHYCPSLCYIVWIFWRSGTALQFFPLTSLRRGTVSEADPVAPRHSGKHGIRESAAYIIPTYRMDLSIKNLQNLDQIWRNVLTSATKHKETIVYKRFRQKMSSSALPCLSSSLLPLFVVVYLSSCTRRRTFCRKRLCTTVSLCFVALVSTFPEISSISSASPAVVYSFVQNLVAELF